MGIWRALLFIINLCYWKYIAFSYFMTESKDLPSSPLISGREQSMQLVLITATTTKKWQHMKPQHNELRNIVLVAPMTCQLPNELTPWCFMGKNRWLNEPWFHYKWKQFLLSLCGVLIRTLVRTPISSQNWTSFPEDALLISSNINKLASITFPNMWKKDLFAKKKKIMFLVSDMQIEPRMKDCNLSFVDIEQMSNLVTDQRGFETFPLLASRGCTYQRTSMTSVIHFLFTSWL